LQGEVQRPSLSRGESGPVPQEVTGEADVLPGERGRVGEQFGGDLTPMLPKVVDGLGQVGRVPIDDGGNHQVQARSPELLGVWTAIGNASLLERADHLSRRARRLTRAGLDVGEAMVKRLGENGRLDPSYATLARDADCDKRTVGRALANMRALGLLRWTRRLVRNGPYVEQTSNAYELTPAGAETPLPSGSTRIGDGQNDRQTNFVDITYCPPSNEVREAQAALARARAVMKARMLENGCRMVPAL
jgi:hypothetical protein